jgi:hypothetical protein
MFPNASVVIGSHELDWSLEQPWGESPVPELYVRELNSSPQLARATNRNMVFSGDACKNRAELLSRAVDMTFDADVSHDSIKSIWRFWSAKPDSVLVRGMVRT